MTIEQARLALINAADSYGRGSVQWKAALRAYNRAVKAASK
jgi:hypothetical protein